MVDTPGDLCDGRGAIMADGTLERADAHADPTRRQMLAIALVAGSVLVFEIAVTRVLSVVLWYHWAFLSVSLAMVGLGAPGVWFSFRAPKASTLRALLVAGGASLPVAVSLIVSVSPRLPSTQVFVCMAAMLLPFLCLGAATCILLIEARGKGIARMYGADLLGASIAALLVIPAMDRIPTPLLVSAVGVLPLFAARLLGARSKSLLAGAAVIVGIVAWGSPLQIRHSKKYDEAVYTPFLERWTATARLTFFDQAFFTPDDAGFAWGRGKRAQAPMVPQYWMEQDGSAGTPVTRFDGDLQDVAFLLGDVTAVGYSAMKPTSVAVIGGGGGRDILAALAAGATSVDAVELNPHVIDIVSNEIAEFSGDPYHQPGVRAIASEGRAFLTRTDRQYDMIQISMIDSWAATAAGAFSLSENNLYTREAYGLYLRRLTDDGVVSTSRWARGSLGVEVPRLVLLAAAALRDIGIDDPKAHIAIVHGGAVGNVLVSRTPWDGPRRRALVEAARKYGFRIAHPRRRVPKRPSRAIRVLHEGPAFLEAKGFDLSPPTDDRPFFFQLVPVLEPVDRAFAEKNGFNAEAVYVLQILMVVLTAITVVLFFAPFALARVMPRGAGFWRGSGYFAAIGLAFMLVEIPWLQRFILFLGHPSLAATAVLGCLLLGSGIGAMISTRFGVARLRTFGLLIPLGLGALNLGLGPAFEAGLALPFLARVATTAILLVPAGIAMGTFFPLGMIAFRDEHKPWFWALNGACGVLASVTSLAASMTFGFTAVAWAGVAAYAVAWTLLRFRP